MRKPKPEMVIRYRYTKAGDDHPSEGQERFVLPDNVTFSSLLEHIRRHSDEVFVYNETCIKRRHPVQFLDGCAEEF